jgi:hypothetical protein
MPDNENTPCFASDPKDDLKLSAENKNRREICTAGPE